jgi:hypothetical protein
MIDTREKRQSLIAISNCPYIGITATPNASPDQEWRQIAGYGYSGILAIDSTGKLIISAESSIVDQVNCLSLVIDGINAKSKIVDTINGESSI